MNGEKIAEFSVPGEPVSKARARFTNYGSKVRTYTPANVVAAEQEIASRYVESGGVLHDDVDMAFGVEIQFLHQTGQRRDIDNMVKAVFDALNGVAWPDDVQVTSVAATKSRVPKGEAATRVTIYHLGRIEKPRGRCLACGAEFAQYASTSKRKYCSRPCGEAYSKQVRMKDCLNCGEKFLPSNGTKSIYCKQACREEHCRVDLVCDYCGDAFTKPQSVANKGRPLCSEQCSLSFHREARKVAAKAICPDCGGPKSTKRAIRCRACNYEANTRWAAGRHVRKESA